MAIINVFRF